MRKLISIFSILVLIFSGSYPGKTQIAAEETLTDPKGESYVFIEKASQVFLQNIDSSIYYFKKGLPYYKKRNNWINYVKCNNGLASCYYYKGDYKNSLFYMEQAQTVAKEKIGEDNSAYTSVLNNLAHIQLEKGEFDQALEKYFKALELEEKMGNTEEVITILNNIGVCLSSKGDVDEAVHYYTQALQSRIGLFGPNDLRIAHSYITIARLFQAKNKLDTALVLHQKAIDLLIAPNAPKGKINIKRQISANLEMARIFSKQNKAGQLNHHLNIAQNLSTKHFDQPAIEKFTISGQWHTQQKEFSKAHQNLERALQLHIAEYQSFQRHPIIGRSYKNLAENHFAEKAYDKSLENYQKAIHHFSEDFAPSNVFANPDLNQLIADQDILEILQGKAKCLLEVYHKKKDTTFLTASNATYQLTLQMIRQLRHDFLANGSKEHLSEIVIPIYEEALEALLAKDNHQLSQKALEKAFQLFESSKAILLLESMNENMAKGFAGIPDSLLLLEQSLKNELLFYKKKGREEKAKGEKANQEKIVSMEEALFQFRRQHQELIASLEKNYPRYYQLKYATRLANIVEVQEKLPDTNAAMVEYFIGKKNNYIFYIDKTEAKMVIQPPNEQLTRDIDQLRNLLKEPYPKKPQQSFDQYIEIAFHLYQQLLKPLDIPSNINQLFITPDDWVSYIPFEVLITQLPAAPELDYSSDNLSYLIKDHAISYNYSATLWLQNKSTASKSGKNFIGFAPSFPKGSDASLSTRVCDDGELYQLQCTEQEVKQISKLLSGDYYIGSKANKASFLGKAENYRILHLATHSCLDDQDPMANKIFFTDDFLSNYDLHNLQLNAELSVLSACNTGNGPLLRGEGVMSLSRGFIHAGCPSTLISMWSVEDCTTADLMVDYYAALKNGLTKEKALQQAKLNYLQQADRLHAHPFYWAPFVQFGETAALEWPNSFYFNKWYLIALGLVFFPFLLWQYRRIS